ncbi:hypothetical protein [Burkholderia vietnamiensis]|uniref:hypothetical protein n=1 Tax=Burkholderia vietnamiensis TaxID=60552 RepID=UPI001CB4E3BF|nr:hypothetical protein [Burkholderia vietnamiensis]CAG9228957.1 hypothetical protein BVI1335_70127 [Burkholderia vietnamiensis]HDR9086343.1 hypothetical protein [Burkholderia vietnamiensis]
MNWLAWIKRCPTFLTERDNATPCPLRIWWFLVFILLLAESGWTAYKGINFDFGVMARSWSEFLTAAGVTIVGKALTEPKEDKGGA